MTIDAFAFPKTDKSEQVQAQRKLAELMMDPAVQTEFTRYKGSVPSRLDANIAVLDRCAKQGQQVMAMARRTNFRISIWCSHRTPTASTSICLRRTGRTRKCRPRTPRRSSPASSPLRATELPVRDNER